MTDVQATTADMELAATAQLEAVREQRFPVGLIVYVALAAAAQVIWLGLIGWWLLTLF
jgi:hypothetical protein